jgi:hypothetical protein
MHTVISSSPTGDLDAATIAAYRAPARSVWFEYDRQAAGFPELVDCDGCEAGIVQRIVTDDSPDCGPSYEAVDGGSIEGRSFYCPACTAAAATSTLEAA